MAGALLSFLERIAAAGRSLIETQFSHEKMAAAYEALYERTVVAHRVSSRRNTGL